MEIFDICKEMKSEYQSPDGAKVLQVCSLIGHCMVYALYQSPDGAKVLQGNNFESLAINCIKSVSVP